MIFKDVLKEIVLSQRELLKRLDLGVLRENKVEILDSFALLITGIRRCGKSTFLYQMLNKQKKGYYLNLEDPRLDGFDLSDFTKIDEIMKELYGKGCIYFFDEIQCVDKWEKFVRYLIDKKEKIVITGSNASLLSLELGTKLTGRHLSIEMFPFSFSEYLFMRKEKASLESFSNYVIKGGFPEYLKKENSLILNELFSDILLKDIAVRFGIKNINILNKIAIHLINNVGKEFSYNSLKNVFDVKSVQSVIDYINYFENSYLIFTVPSFSYSYKQQQVRPKKVYSIDTGFSANNSVSFSKDYGRMLENVVFLNLRRKNKEIYFFKEKNECDFVIKEKNQIKQCVQVCFVLNEENKIREVNGLLEALKIFKLKEGLILTNDQMDEINIEDKKILVKPVWKWLLET